MVDPVFVAGKVSANPGELSVDVGGESLGESVEASSGANVSDIGNGCRDHSLGRDRRHRGVLQLYSVLAIMYEEKATGNRQRIDLH